MNEKEKAVIELATKWVNKQFPNGNDVLKVYSDLEKAVEALSPKILVPYGIIAKDDEGLSIVVAKERVDSVKTLYSYENGQDWECAYIDKNYLIFPKCELIEVGRSGLKKGNIYRIGSDYFIYIDELFYYHDKDTNQIISYLNWDMKLYEVREIE